ncbi:uncharacterized protein LOC134507824 isoform X1 [Chroicocephalus ridibundus]|uniref:uncharacterized protein LOC134507824 isoform X1 n=1 Tax=Chroicocephalus ridibundus TaxID=1192867 RepID=UPI002FDDCA20
MEGHPPIQRCLGLQAEGYSEESWAGAPRSIQCGSWCWLCWWFWCWLWPWLLLHSQQEDMEGIQLCLRLWCWPVLRTGLGTAMSATPSRGLRGAGSGARSSAPRMGPRWPCPGGRGRWSSSGVRRPMLIAGLGCGDKASACSGWMAAASTRQAGAHPRRPLPWRGSSRSWRRATDLRETGLADGWIDTRGARGTAGRSSPAMAEEITYADLAIGPGNRRRDLHSLPQPGASGCPQWHRTALWTGWTGNLLLGVAVVAMGCSLLHQQSENPGSCKNVSRNVGDGNITLQNVCSELREALCSSKPQEGEGCKLCPMNWTLRGTKCYWVSGGINPWNVSREDCANRGAELLLPEDQDELDFLNKTLQKPAGYFWIGLYAGKGWTWLNGSRLDPSRFQLSPRAEGGSCGVIKEGRISSDSCVSTLRWICQKKATQL